MFKNLLLCFADMGHRKTVMGSACVILTISLYFFPYKTLYSQTKKLITKTNFWVKNVTIAIQTAYKNRSPGKLGLVMLA